MVIGFSNLKGGVGKSKLNAYFADYLANKGFDTVLIDCDVNQRTTEVYDVSEKGLPDNLTLINYRFEAGDIKTFINDHKDVYDFVLVDLPGTIQQDGVISAASCIDKIIIPTTTSKEDLNSSLKYTEILNLLNQTGHTSIDYKILINNYEVQFGLKLEEEENFPTYQKIFDNNVFPKGIRKERSLLQNKFILGDYGNHANSKRVEETLDLIFEFINKN